MGVETTREAVVRAATELFAAHGYHAVGMRAIAEAVDLRTASLYHHFPSKAALLSVIARAATSSFIDDALVDLRQPGPAAPRLGRVLHDHIVYFHEHRLEEAITRRDLAALPEDVMTEIQAERRAYHAAVTETIAAGCATGEFRVASPHLATFAILDAVNGINVWYRPAGAWELGALADAYVEMILHGMLSAVRPTAVRPTPDRPDVRNP